MIDTRCGLVCQGCTWKASHGCGGCIATMGHPFHGECPVARCCQERGLAHCGECDELPCALLFRYSYLDLEHGDRPQGDRVTRLRRWAAEGGRQWEHVLLTSAGLSDMEGRPRPNILARFQAMLGVPPAEARVLFIPTAAINDEAKAMLEPCRQDLILAGVRPKHIAWHDLDGSMDGEHAMAFDAVYVAGGDTRHLMRRVRETGFDRAIKRMVYTGKTYLGVSAGSLIATPNVGDPYDEATAGLALIRAYLSVHCPEGATVRDDLPLPHLPLNDHQALAVSWAGWERIED